MNTIAGLQPRPMQNSPTDQSELSEDGFMKMLLAQLQTQDPLKPFDASTMMQQISQLTNLSASQKMVDSVSELKSSNGVSQMLSAAQLVGKNVQLATDKIQMTDARKASAAVVVPPGADKIEVAICDMSGNKVRTLELSTADSGVLDFEWDGLDEKGNPVAEGFYSMEASANVQGQELQLATAASYTVQSVALDSKAGKVILNVDGLGGVSMDDVIKIL